MDCGRWIPFVILGIVLPGCGTLAHQHDVGMGNGRADLWPPYRGVETDIQALRSLEEDTSVTAALWKPFFVLDCPLSAIGDTLFLPRWAILKAIHKDEPLPPWREAELERESRPGEQTSADEVRE